MMPDTDPDIVDRIQQIEDHIEALERRIDALEGVPAGDSEGWTS